MHVTFIGAHPDDEMSALGTLLKCRRRGDRLSLIVMTNGDKGMSDDPSVAWADCARVRAREMRKVADALRAPLVMLGEPDEALYDAWPVRLKLIEAIRKVRAELVFTHFTSDYNLDHTITSTLVFQCAMLSQIASIRTESPALRKVPAIFYADPGPGYGFEATHFVEIEAAQVKEMRRLMGFHASQMAVARRLLGADYRDTVVERLRQNGARVGVPYAEAFRPCLASRRTPLANTLP